MRRDRSASKAQGTPEQRPGNAVNAVQRWQQLTSIRRGFMHRLESYASVTIPKVLLPDHVDQNSASIQHDWTSVGAQCVNHITNKIVTALFQPGLPFFRLDLPAQAMQDMQSQTGMKEEDVKGALVAGEQAAVKLLDQRAIRPTLHSLIRSLVVVGNILLDLSDDDNPRAISIKDYCVKRSIKGAPQEILHREKVLWDELDDKARAVAPRPRHGEDAYVEYCRWFVRRGTKWFMTIWVDDKNLGPDFEHSWTLDKFPLYPLCWDLADKHNYGTGLVEDYAGDFGTLSTLSESEIKAAILVSDFRWLANPGGVGDIEEFKRSTTGDVIAGKAGDLELVAHVSTNALQQLGASVERVINRLGRAFLLSSAVTRQAERVTAEEIRMQAQELESSMGGVYSRLALDLQVPLAFWIMRQVKMDIDGTAIKPTIVTGLSALSRNIEATQLKLALGDIGAIGTLPDNIAGRLKLSAIIATIFAAYGITAPEYVISDDEYAALVQQQQQEAQEAEARSIATQAGADRMAQQQE